jgi:hypothetical protein
MSHGCKLFSLSFYSLILFFFSLLIFWLPAAAHGRSAGLCCARGHPDQETSLLLSSSMRHSLSKKKYLRTNNYMWEEPSIPFSLSLILLLLLFTDGNAK